MGYIFFENDPQTTNALKISINTKIVQQLVRLETSRRTFG